MSSVWGHWHHYDRTLPPVTVRRIEPIIGVFKDAAIREDGPPDKADPVQCCRVSWQSQPELRTAADEAQYRLAMRAARNAIYSIAALSALPVRADLANTVENFELDPLPGETSEKAADGVRSPTRRLGDLRTAGSFAPSQHGQNPGVLGVLRPSSPTSRGKCTVVRWQGGSQAMGPARGLMSAGGSSAQASSRAWAAWRRASRRPAPPGCGRRRCHSQAACSTYSRLGYFRRDCRVGFGRRYFGRGAFHLPDAFQPSCRRAAHQHRATVAGAPSVTRVTKSRDLLGKSGIQKRSRDQPRRCRWQFRRPDQMVRAHRRLGQQCTRGVG
jgi:hypothetical protein